MYITLLKVLDDNICKRTGSIIRNVIRHIIIIKTASVRKKYYVNSHHGILSVCTTHSKPRLSKMYNPIPKTNSKPRLKIKLYLF